MSTQSVEFQTIDGIVLRGTLYLPAADNASHASRGSAVILTPGVSCVGYAVLRILRTIGEIGSR